jgi:hypothetical protein
MAHFGQDRERGGGIFGMGGMDGMRSRMMVVETQNLKNEV